MTNTNGRTRFDSTEAAKNNGQVPETAVQMKKQVPSVLQMEELEARIAPCRLKM